MKKIQSLFFYFAFLALILSPGFALALDNFSLSTGSSGKVLVVPERFEFFGERGAVSGQAIRITNDSDREIIFSLSAENISGMSDHGEAIFAIGKDMQEGSELASWISFSQKSGLLAAKESRTIDLLISVPNDAEPGGKYGSIILSSDYVIREGNEGGTNKIASLILLIVAGGSREEAAIKNYKIEKENAFSQDSSILSFNIQNTGNVHIKPKGNVVISNIFGKKLYSIEVAAQTVLPNSKRLFEVPLEKGFKSGVYTVTFVGDYGQSYNHGLSETTVYIVWPRYLLLDFVGLIIAAYLILWFFRKRGKHSRRA